MNDVIRPVPAQALAPLGALSLLVLAALWLVAFADATALAQVGGTLHELMHDGRHLLGIPCH